MPMISLQVSPKIIEELDSIQQKLGYSSRSETLRISIMNFIRENQKKAPTEDHRIASITVHHDIREDVLDRFSILSQQFDSIIKSVNQYNLKNKVIKTIIVAGTGIEIDEFFHELSSDRLFQPTITYIIVPERDAEMD